MKKFVLISALIEIVAGALFFCAPQLIPDLADAEAGYLSLMRMYGGAALALGVFAFQVWRNFDQTILRKIFLITYLAFNSLVAIAIYTCYTAGVMSDLGGTFLHTTLALITAYFYFKNGKD